MAKAVTFKDGWFDLVAQDTNINGMEVRFNEMGHIYIGSPDMRLEVTYLGPEEDADKQNIEIRYGFWNDAWDASKDIEIRFRKHTSDPEKTVNEFFETYVERDMNHLVIKRTGSVLYK